MSVLAAVAPYVSPWRWHVHISVWVILGAVGLAYALAVVRVGPRHVPRGRPAVRPGQVAAFAAGLATLWVGADWPLHDLGERFLYSAHMVQHMLFSLVAPPLLLLGTPAWMARGLVRHHRVGGIVRWVTRPLPAALVFNAVVVLTHWPALVDVTLHHEVAHFAAHLVLVLAALAMWTPVVSPIPELPRLSAPSRCVYLFLQSIIPTVPASFLTFATHPIYTFYAHVPRLWGLSASEDQRIAGVTMKLGGGMLLWSAIAVIFFRWYAEEEAQEVRARGGRRSRLPRSESTVPGGNPLGTDVPDAGAKSRGDTRP